MSTSWPSSASASTAPPVGPRRANAWRWSTPWARISHWQGWRTRYRGQGKNLLDLHRATVAHNLFV